MRRIDLASRTAILAGMPAPSSPCIQICVIELETGICRGCRRTLAEIAAWGAMPEAERQRIMAILPARVVTSADRAGDAA